MAILERMVIGAFVGAVAYAISFYGFIVLGAYVTRGKLDFGGEWGGFIVGAIIGFIVGGVIGCIIGVANLTTKTVLIASLVIGIFLMILEAFSFFSSPEYQQQRIFEEIISCIIFILILVFNNWLINKSVLSVQRKNVD